MLFRFLSKISVPTFHFQPRSISSQNNLITTLYPTLSPEAASRTSANRFSVMSNASTIWSSSSVDEPSTPVDEIKEIIPLISINAEQEIHRVAHKTLQQCIDLLRRLPSDDNYIYESKFLPSSTIGKHIRHIYDHFRLLLDSKPLKANHLDYHDEEEPKDDFKFWTVDYDNRLINVPAETLRQTAIKQLEQLQARILSDCTLISLNTPIQIDATVDSEMLMDPIPFKSTYGRELWFCCHHAVHHFALISVICTEQNIIVPKDFGVAPSTIKRQRHNEFEHLVKE